MQVLTGIFVYHVLVQEVGGHRRNASYLQVLVKGFLKVLIQITMTQQMELLSYTYKEMIQTNHHT